MAPTCMSCDNLLEFEEHYYLVFPEDNKCICMDCLHTPNNALVYNFLRDKGALSPEDILDAEI